MPNALSIINTLAEFGIVSDFTARSGIDTSDYVNKLNRTHNSINQLINDSRDLQPGDIFCAVIGSEQDGREYIDLAIDSGAILVLAECQSEQQHGTVLWKNSLSSTLANNDNQIAVIQFYQLNHELFALAKSYYQQPQKNMVIIGITGTNGKTSTCQLIAKLLDANNKASAIIGTNGAGKVANLSPINNTTPGATQLTRLLASFSNNKISHVAMEVSSHALAQRRVTKNLFNIAIFTNLSRDHLDFHQTMKNYEQAKREIFTGDNKQLAIINGDDNIGQQWLADWPKGQPVIVYGRSAGINEYKLYVKATKIQHHQTGVSFLLTTHIGDININSPLMADFNIDNLLAAIAVLLSENIKLSVIAKSVAILTPIIGRMETITAKNKVTAVVDYAHTPDALKNALLACRQHCTGELWLVFGCGGNRDKGKRALMGAIAEQLADHIIITNDNPRSEAPEIIANEVLTGFKDSERAIINLDRKQAVLSTLGHAKADDFVLLAGKGHEDYIIIGDKKLNYNERDVVNSFYQSGQQL
ncbi:MAG: UDP-N-acetylmuramoyl-L-alanyl-D-glutamate--2,6-diaminopimelate ligase [Colwellia sp.]|nr:UDP-N-acetylmuramoyl-L-alanyl-D-glutamate--2,6-diaminopimelate ligase [Colwellia sp.]